LWCMQRAPACVSVGAVRVSGEVNGWRLAQRALGGVWLACGVCAVRVWRMGQVEPLAVACAGRRATQRAEEAAVRGGGADGSGVPPSRPRRRLMAVGRAG